MSDPTTEWRPATRLRAIAIGLIRQDARLLVSAVTGDDGRVKGWRPLGGGIEFGESAETALRRELHEEIGATAGPLVRIAVLENLFHHQGQPGHEIVFVFEGSLLDPGAAATERFFIEERGRRDLAAWMPAALFRDGAMKLFPDGLIGYL
ncbi:NUDIX domain-containing protein [Frigidibacter sp. SD6-1]|uniref:NUDIX hydrolase n=1 Tax=Frigidibacter sp. SD6-1 TaxID=3032581 RepID=UPI0024E029CB|nr:NUDIX domain-containing protein [Frigidibacter sp. SD6-1]